MPSGSSQSNRGGSFDLPRCDVFASDELGVVEIASTASEQLRLQQAALETTANAVVITDPEGTILWTNPAFTTLTGYPAAEALGQTPRMLKSGHHNDGFYQELWRTLRSGYTWRGEVTNRRKDGSLYQGEQVITPIPGGGKGITHFIAVMNDLTARKRAEAELRTKAAQLGQLLDHSPVVLYMLRVHGDLLVPTIVSENVTPLLGFTMAETLCVGWWDEQVHPDDRAVVAAALQRARATGQGTAEYRIRHKDGSYRVVEDKMRLVRGADGKTADLIGVWTDITERKRAEELLGAAAVRDRRQQQTWHRWLTVANAALGVSAAVVLFFSERAGAPGALGLLVACVGLLFYWQRRGARSEAMHEGRVQNALRKLRDELETRVQQRTAELAKAYDASRAEISERARAERELERSERALQESEALYHSLVEQLPAGVYRKDAAGRYVFVNSWFARLVGLQPADYIGRTAAEIAEKLSDQVPLTEEARAGVVAYGQGRDHHDRIMKTGERIELEESLSRPDGRSWSLQLVKAPVLDSAGVIVGSQGIVFDTTARKNAEKQLLEQREQWRALVSASANAVFVVRDDKLVMANPAAGVVFGAVPDELRGRNILEFIPENFHPLLRARVQMAQQQDAPLPLIELTFRRRDGALIEVESSSVRIQFEGSPALLVEARDITERKRAEMRLKLQHAVTQVLAEGGSLERTNQRVLETIGRAQQWEHGELWMVDRGANILRCAETWHLPSSGLHAFASARRQMTFAAGKGLPGRVWASGGAEWVPDPRGICGDECSTLLSMGVRSWVGFPVKLRDEFLGVVGFFSGQANEPDGQMISTVAALGSQLAQFIERHQLADQFRQAQKMEAIGTLASGIAHDFNNIIAAIAGYTELAKMELSANSKARQHLEEVLVGSTRAAALVRQILAFSRQQDHERKPIQLRHIVREAMTLLRATIPATIDFDLRCDGNLPPVLADATQVHQVVMNLGTNARHAMKDRPGRLGLTLEPFQVDRDVAEQHPGLRPGRYVRLSVSDTGHGMDRATLSRVFEPFFTTKGPGEGTGLGLAVVHGIMQTHEGAITVYSQPGEGTVFRLYFPIAASESAPAPEDELKIPRGHGERVLYVDDEPPLAAMGRKILERLGYDVDSRTNPHDAIAAVQAQPDRYALVITDLAMPEMNGTQLAEELLNMRPTLPILLITGYSASLTPARAQAMGFHDLLSKPISVHAIGTAVARILAVSKPS